MFFYKTNFKCRAVTIIFIALSSDFFLSVNVQKEWKKNTQK